jgi:molybdopterin-guanine dinucleotide biosynthesis adapter protein
MNEIIQPPFVVGIWGCSDSGKTRLVEQLIPVLKGRGFRVGTLKHATHKLSMDVAGKDSHRHAVAGAERVVLIGPGSAALFVYDNVDPELKAWLSHFNGQVDILLVEGFKRTTIPHVQIMSQDENDEFSLCLSMQEGGPEWILRRPSTMDTELQFPTELVERLAAEIVESSSGN